MNVKIHILFLSILLFFVYDADAQINASFDIQSSNSVICNLDTVYFTNQSQNFTYVKWDFGDGYQTYVENPKHIYLEAGRYTVNLIAFDDDGNTGQYSQSIDIEQIPSLELEPDGEITINEGTQLTVEAQGDFTEILWSDGSSDLQFQTTTAGSYFVTVSNASGCKTTDSLTVIVRKIESSEIQIELTNNIITPNGDGINDFLIIRDFELRPEKISLKIYNRFGLLIFENDDYRNDWSGTDANGNILDSGTYYYLIESGGQTGGTGFIDILN